jgi:hypothetical protein
VIPTEVELVGQHGLFEVFLLVVSDLQFKNSDKLSKVNKKLKL